MITTKKTFQPLDTEKDKVVKTQVKRNDPCFCGSGKKYKKCCLIKEHEIQKSILDKNNAKEKQKSFMTFIQTLIRTANAERNTGKLYTIDKVDDVPVDFSNLDDLGEVYDPYSELEEYKP